MIVPATLTLAVYTAREIYAIPPEAPQDLDQEP